jgi:hypothetical protein
MISPGHYLATFAGVALCRSRKGTAYHRRKFVLPDGQPVFQAARDSQELEVGLKYMLEVRRKEYNGIVYYERVLISPLWFWEY